VKRNSICGFKLIRVTIYVWIMITISCITKVSASSLDTYRLAAAEANKSFPIRKDRVTVLRSAICVKGSPKNVFTYVLDLEVSKDLAKGVDFERGIKPDVVRTFCTDPKIRPVIEAFDVDHRYYANKGEFVGSFLITSKDCK
jgi:hypothetical protein